LPLVLEQLPLVRRGVEQLALAADDLDWRDASLGEPVQLLLRLVALGNVLDGARLEEPEDGWRQDHAGPLAGRAGLASEGAAVALALVASLLKRLAVREQDPGLSGDEVVRDATDSARHAVLVRLAAERFGGLVVFTADPEQARHPDLVSEWAGAAPVPGFVLADIRRGQGVGVHPGPATAGLDPVTATRAGPQGYWELAAGLGESASDEVEAAGLAPAAASLVIDSDFDGGRSGLGHVRFLSVRFRFQPP